MKSTNIWIGEKDLTRDEKFMESVDKEFASEDVVTTEAVLNQDGNRRDFLKMMGFGLGAATVAAGCDIPVKRAIPYVIKPDEIVPGVASYYATTIVEGGDFCNVLVKTREGRPIKIEGNNSSTITEGGTTARAQASVLSLYDTNRYKAPQVKDGEGWAAATWDQVDAWVKGKLSSGKIRVISNTVLSPAERAVMSGFSGKYGGSKVITYDPVSAAGILEANETSFGDRVIPGYRFDKADVIVSFGADFLGTWISPMEYAQQYVKGRKIKDVSNPTMSRHYQIESQMTLTGSNADNRILVKPSEQGAAIAYLCNSIVGGVSVPSLNAKAKKALDKVATDLRKAAGKSLVVSSSNNPAEQILVNAINNLLGNYGTTINFSDAALTRSGNERDLEKLISEIKSGLVDTVIFNQCNPLYDSPIGAKLATALANVPNKIGLLYAPSETAAICDVIAPIHHGLESWGDVEAKRGHYSLIQPTISPLFNTRQGGLSLLNWSGSDKLDTNSEQPYLAYLKGFCQENIFPQANGFGTFKSFWETTLKDGGAKISSSSNAAGFNASVASAASQISKPKNSDLEISFFETANLGNGQGATNPWLMEMPDPVTRTSWGNYLAVPVNFDGVRSMEALNGLKDGDLVTLTVGDKAMTVPVVQQFGQMPGTVSLALGYGRENSSAVSAGVGVNVNDCLTVENGLSNYYNSNVTVSGKTGEEKYFSSVQYHGTYGVTTEDKDGKTINADEETLGMAYGQGGYQGALTDRSVIYNTNVNELKDSIAHLEEKRAEAQHLNDQTLYPFDEYTAEKYSQGHHWGMHVDLNACIGCGACTVSCMAENNVPVVGKKEVSRHHEMTWLRIDRYFYGDIESPNTVYQPMMCQHCDNAPCENVCPVSATNHSSEGLNQMIYNRCVGTRYCANNCPYKVRRFNWLDYTTADLFPANQPTLNGEEVPYGADNLTRMVLNPDVTVRSRGVIEKCSFCAQRLQEGKLTAKREARKLRSSDVRSACQTACPTGAITFGDLNDKNGDLAKALKSPLNYVALEEINVQSSVTYTMKVNNRETSVEA